MGKLIKIFLVILALLVAVCAGIYLTGNTQYVLMQLIKPSHGFDLSYKVPRLDYADPASWAALPDRQDLADLIPAGVAARDTRVATPVAVFFVHPTTYLHGDDWNDPLADGTITEENTKWVLANQASAYNGCCDVYAPRYRQATVVAFSEGVDAETREQALELAYSDVEAAFEHFIERGLSDRWRRREGGARGPARHSRLRTRDRRQLRGPLGHLWGRRGHAHPVER